MSSAFFADPFVDILSTGAETAHMVKFVCTELLDAFKVMDSEEIIDRQELPDVVAAAVTRIRKVVAAFVSLLDPTDSCQQASIEDVEAVKSTANSHHMDVTVKALLSGTGFYAAKAEEQQKKGRLRGSGKALV